MAGRSGKRWRRWPWFALAMMLVLALLAGAPVWLWRAPAAGAPGDGLVRVLLGIHVHTAANGVTADIDAVASAARKAGLDAVWITDHDAYPQASVQGWRAGVLVLIGCERATSAGHLLSLATARPPFPLARDAAGAIADTQALGGIALAAHPHRPGPERLRWRDDPSPGGSLAALDGVEIVNLDAAWREQPWRLVFGIFGGGLSTARALAAVSAPEPQALALWDRMLERRLALATAASDAHGSFPGYEAVLGTVANVVLLERPLQHNDAVDLDAVSKAVAAGRSFIAWTAVADPRAAAFVATRGAETFRPGDLVPIGSGVELQLSSGLQVVSELRIVHRGIVVAAKRGRSLAYTAREAGAYRGEIDIPGAPHSPWLLTSAIGLVGVDWPASVAGRAPEPVAASGKTPPLGLLDRLQPEHDTRSLLALDRDATMTAIRWRLGQRDSAQREVWVALVDRSGPRSLMKYSELVIDADAPAPVRFDLGFNLPDQRDSEGNVRAVRTVRSIRLDATRREIRLPLASFAAGGAPMKSGNVLLTLDQDNAWPGTSGEARIYSLRLE